MLRLVHKVYFWGGVSAMVLFFVLGQYCTSTLLHGVCSFIALIIPFFTIAYICDSIAEERKESKHCDHFENIFQK